MLAYGEPLNVLEHEIVRVELSNDANKVFNK